MRAQFCYSVLCVGIILGVFSNQKKVFNALIARYGQFYELTLDARYEYKPVKTYSAFLKSMAMGLSFAYLDKSSFIDLYVQKSQIL